MRNFLYLVVLPALVLVSSSHADQDVYLNDVPDYLIFGGVPATACGNLGGYWDIHGFSNLYTGPTANGVAPLFSSGANAGIRSLWATKSGMDGRTNTLPGHIDDYWTSYNIQTGAGSFESTAPDPYILNHRPEHPPDCIGDFIGASQRKWTNMNGECDGNIDGAAFVYWAPDGNRRTNFVPGPEAGLPSRDLPSGLRAWSQWRGYDAEVSSQLTEFVPGIPTGAGFTFDDLKREIDHGYPVLLWLQPTNEFSRPLGLGSANAMLRANPRSWAVLAYGYYIGDDASEWVHVRNSGNGTVTENWSGDNWSPGYPVRGAITFHPKPRITNISRDGANISLTWEALTGRLYNSDLAGSTNLTRQFVIERATAPDGPYNPLTAPSTNRIATFSDCCSDAAFFRVRQLDP